MVVCFTEDIHSVFLSNADQEALLCIYARHQMSNITALGSILAIVFKGTIFVILTVNNALAVTGELVTGVYLVLEESEGPRAIRGRGRLNVNWR